MTVTRTVFDAVQAAQRDLPFSMPLLTARDQIARDLHLPQHVVQTVLTGNYLTVQERAA